MFTPIPATPIAAPSVPGEEPCPQTDAHAGAIPSTGDAMSTVFHRRAAIERVVDDLAPRTVADPRTAGICEGEDMVRLRRAPKAPFRYALNGRRDRRGRDMADARRDLGRRPARTTVVR